MKEKQAVTKQLALEYKRAGKKGKGRILDSLVQSTDYKCSYAGRVLRKRYEFAETLVLLPAIVRELLPASVEAGREGAGGELRWANSTMRPRPYYQRVLAPDVGEGGEGEKERLRENLSNAQPGGAPAPD